MANWKRMWPPRECGPCLCRRKVWRSRKSRITGAWSTPVLIYDAVNQECEPGQFWKLVGACEAEFVRVSRCNDDYSPENPPPPPTITTPDCPPADNPCVLCGFEDIPDLASVQIGGTSWGTATGSVVDPFTAFLVREQPCFPATQPFCHPCNKIPLMTVVHQREIVPNFVLCGAWPEFEQCLISFNSGNFITVNYTTSCCSTAYIRLFSRVTVYRAKPSGPCFVHVGVQMTYPVAYYGYFSTAALNTATYEYISAPLGPSIVSTVVPVNFQQSCVTSGVFSGIANSTVCSSPPSTLNVTFGAAA